MKKGLLLIGILFICRNLDAQLPLNNYSKFASAPVRRNFYESIIKNTINKGLSLSVSPANEDKFIDAFNAINIINYHQAWINAVISKCVDSIENFTADYQQSLLDLIYANEFPDYTKQISLLSLHTSNPLIFSMCIVYIKQQKQQDINFDSIYAISSLSKSLQNKPVPAILETCKMHLNGNSGNISHQQLAAILSNHFLPHQVVVYSLQRKNRNYPGLVIIKNKEGRFEKNDDGKLFSLPQLARSHSNMPYYISNGNTPQGLFRMYGIDTSKSDFIGPTDNIQLTMPFETSIRHFLKDSTLKEKEWTTDFYNQLLPAICSKHPAFWETYFAGKIGRNSIIAHGTTLDPDYYIRKEYYPLTPTEGCLSTKETWDEKGIRLYSDQLKLANAIRKAGGADGYLLVIDINDAATPITPEEIIPYLDIN